MSVKAVHIGEGERRQAPMEGGPTAEILLKGEEGRSMGIIEVTIPADGAMGLHSHGESETLVIAEAGALRMYPEGDDSEILLEPGTIVTIPVGQKVRLDNTGNPDGRFLAVLTPADFISQLESWPLAEAATASA